MRLNFRDAAMSLIHTHFLRRQGWDGENYHTWLLTKGFYSIREFLPFK
jgi:hypothetical protein